MAKTLRIPNEARFVRAFAMAVDPGDTLSLLLEVGALRSRDLAVVRCTREALDAAYEWASDLKDWDQTHTISVLRQALAQPDSAAYLAYAQTQEESLFSESLAVIGCAADSLTSRRHPWEIEPNDLFLPGWREQVWKLLFGLSGNALPKPSEPQPPAPPDSTICIGSESDSPAACAGDHTDWCPAKGEAHGPH